MENEFNTTLDDMIEYMKEKVKAGESFEKYFRKNKDSEEYYIACRNLDLCSSILRNLESQRENNGATPEVIRRMKMRGFM